MIFQWLFKNLCLGSMVQCWNTTTYTSVFNKWWNVCREQCCPLVCGEYQSCWAPSSSILCPNTQLQSINSKGAESICRLEVTYWKRLKKAPHCISSVLKSSTLSLPKSEWQKGCACYGWMSKSRWTSRGQEDPVLHMCVFDFAGRSRKSEFFPYNSQ